MQAMVTKVVQAGLPHKLFSMFTIHSDPTSVHYLSSFVVPDKVIQIFGVTVAGIRINGQHQFDMSLAAQHIKVVEVRESKH